MPIAGIHSPLFKVADPERFPGGTIHGLGKTCSPSISTGSPLQISSRPYCGVMKRVKGGSNMLASWKPAKQPRASVRLSSS